VRVGTSGFAYKEWRGRFYPEDIEPAAMLAHYARTLGTVEINNTFYRMPSATLLERWAGQVGDDFAFVLKASRRITHHGRIGDGVRESVDYLFDKAAALGAKLGPVLFQLPPTLRRDLPRLEAFLDMLPPGRRAAIEFRHRSWIDDAVFAALAARNAALCVADGELGGELPGISTADWGYLRLREADYDDAALAAWAARVRDAPWTDAFVFFKHEEDAPHLATRFIAAVEGSAPCPAG